MVTYLRQCNFFSHDDVNFFAALCVGFAGFLRAREFTWEQWSPFSSPRLHLSRQHVTFDNRTGSVTILLPSSKTDPLAKGTEIYLPATGTKICPVAALHHLFERFPAHPAAPLFCRHVGPFSRSHFVERVKATLLNIEIDPSKFSGHSLQKGAAVSAYREGIPRSEIQLLGRWKSDAVDIYINEVSKLDHQAKLLDLRTQLLHS